MICVTFNMGESCFSIDNKSEYKFSEAMNQMEYLFSNSEFKHYIIVFSTQEAEKSIVGSLINDKK